ncbi:hypothetical protein HNQ88_004202 [Aureibacter tunicatorum]|uniref:Uncharacterized protein n=1 Tax=Aureibacter tunicatorum TaxID=866807 RepID=A0AAE3XSK7_9BACT|nr:hypothetical protein [Aureibacter tunicatorum]BDD03904.1 hypothetical protein AUTU_13870 [Aureibacter tunicatorum]
MSKTKSQIRIEGEELYLRQVHNNFTNCGMPCELQRKERRHVPGLIIWMSNFLKKIKMSEFELVIQFRVVYLN